MADTTLSPSAKAAALQATMAVKHMSEHTYNAFNMYDEALAGMTQKAILAQEKNNANYDASPPYIQQDFDKKAAARDAATIHNYVTHMTGPQKARYEAMDFQRQDIYNQALLSGSTLTVNQKILYGETVALFDKADDSRADKANFCDSLYRLGRQPKETEVAVAGKLIYHGIHSQHTEGLAADTLVYVKGAKDINYITSPAQPGKPEQAHTLDDVLQHGMTIHENHQFSNDYSIGVGDDSQSLKGTLDYMIKNAHAVKRHESEASQIEVVTPTPQAAQQQIIGH